MLYTTFKMGQEELKLRLGSRDSIALERKLGTNPLNIFMELSEGGLPKLEPMVAILHASAQKYQHGLTEDKFYDLYDEFVDNGGSLTQLIPVVLEVFKVSGFFNEAEMKQAEAQAKGEVSPN